MSVIYRVIILNARNRLLDGSLVCSARPISEHCDVCVSCGHSLYGYSQVRKLSTFADRTVVRNTEEILCLHQFDTGKHNF
jgi:hypothetical protein